jgi:hypothetical protein
MKPNRVLARPRYAFASEDKEPRTKARRITIYAELKAASGYRLEKRNELIERFFNECQKLGSKEMSKRASPSFGLPTDADGTGN